MLPGWTWMIVRWCRRGDAREVLFQRNRLLCLRCHAAVPLEGLEPFSLAPCPRCRAPNFVPKKIGSFVLFEPVGAGANASAYKAWREDQGNRPFAVKLLRHDQPLTGERIQAFLGEGEIHSRIPHHENLPDYGGHGHEDGEYYYAAEFISGERLKHRLVREGKLRQDAVLRIAGDVLSALQHILDHGYLYRDVNVGNIILRPDGTAVLVDFGLTEAVDVAAAKKQEAFAEGAAAFIPPERILRAGENEASIIYSLGMLMYLLLTGGDCVKASDVVRAAMRHIGPRLAITQSQMPGCADGVVNLIARMTKADPAGRFQSFHETLEAIAGIAV